MSYQAYNNEVEIQSVELFDENNNLLIDLAAENSDGKIALDFITFTETLNTPIIEGSLVFDGTRGQYELLQLVGNETLVIKAKSPDSDSDEENESIDFPIFSVYGFQDSSNFSDTNKTPEGFTTRKITIKFCTREAKELFEKDDLLPTGFIGKICSGLTFEAEESEDNTGEGGEGEGGGEEGEGTEEEPVLIDKRGLIEVIEESIEGGIDSEPTLNDVWIKPQLVSLPHRKPVESMNPLQMLNYCSNYAISAENPVAVNYFFWQDLAGFHFKSADFMIYESQQDQDNEKVFTISTNMIGKSRIYRFDVISDFSLYSSLSNNQLLSYYYRYEPDYYSSPYARLMDDREKYTKEKVVFNYKDIFNDLYGVEDGDPFPFITKEKLEELGSSVDEFSVTDVVYGYHSDRAFNDPDNIRSVLLLGDELLIGASGASGGEGGEGEEEEGLFTFVNDDEESSEENAGGSAGSGQLAHFNAYETNKWQAMFDCMDLEGETLKKIITDIKLPTFKAKKEYRDKLAYKEQWNIYKYSVCCADDDASDDGIMAVVKEAKRIGRNIYRYSWNEVTFIPKAALANFAGGTGPEEDYVNDINTINAQAISNANWGDLTFSKFGEQMETPLIVGDLSGDILISATTCGISFPSPNSVTRVLKEYLGCDIEGNTTGVTFAFHNDAYSPLLVVENPNGAKGTFDSSSGAYNLNEILNRPIYDESQYEVLAGCEGCSASSVLFYQELPLGGAPELSEETDVLIGPGINANKELTDYPAGFASMPVGSYQRIDKDEDGSPIVSEIGSSVECKAIPMGHVVKVQSVKTSKLPLYGINIHAPEINSIYYFNATNAQDGNCSTQIDCGIGRIE